MKMLLLAILASTLVSVTQASGQTEPADLTRAEEQAVVAAAEKALQAQALWRGKIFLTDTAVVFDSSVSPSERYALLTFYRYEGNVAILLTVNLEKMTVTKVTTHPHMPTSLATAEIAEAQKIASANPNIQRALARYKHLDKIEIDTIVAQIIKPDLPGYHHRVARLFFRDAERNYLAGVPMVDVDLTTGEVRFDVIKGMHAKQ